MKRIAIFALSLTLAALPAQARWHLPWNRTAANPLQQLLDPNGGIPILDPADLQAVHAVLTPYIAAGAGVKVKAMDNCALAILNHPEYLTPSTPPPAATVAPVQPAGPLSTLALDVAKADAGIRALQRKAALFAAPPPDDVVLACAALEPSPGGVWRSIQSLFHPAAVGGAGK